MEHPGLGNSQSQKELCFSGDVQKLENPYPTVIGRRQYPNHNSSWRTAIVILLITLIIILKVVATIISSSSLVRTLATAVIIKVIRLDFLLVASEPSHKRRSSAAAMCNYIL